MTPADYQKANSNGRLRHILDQVESEERVALQMITLFQNQCDRDRQTLQQVEGNANQTFRDFCDALNRYAFGNGPGSSEQAYAVNELADAQLAEYNFQVPVRERLWNVAIEAVRA